MLFKPNALVYVHRNGLVVAGKHITQARLVFPPELVTNLEVVHPEKLIEQCRQFFADHDLGGKRVRIVLDSSVVFRKNIELDAAGKPDALTEAFIAAIPFAAGQRACLKVEADKLLQLLATNADLYESIAEALRLCGVTKLVGIVPAAAFDLSGINRDLTAMIERLSRTNPISKQIDFANAKPL